MRTIKFTAFLFYRYYSTGATKEIPYGSTLCAMVMLLILHFFQIVALFDLKNLLLTSSMNTRGTNFLITALSLLPIFGVMSLVIKKSDLKEMRYDNEKIKRGNIYLVIYIITSILLIPLLVLLRQGHL